MTDQQILALSVQCGTINDFGKTLFTDGELLDFAQLLHDKFIAELGEPVAYTDYYRRTVGFTKTGYPLYALKDERK